jgi:hypothetical protein
MPGEPEPGRPGPAAAGPAGWTTGRIVSAVIGGVLVLLSLGPLGGGGAAWAAAAHRHGGYVNLGTESYRTGGHALPSQPLELYTATGAWDVARSLIGTVRLRVTATQGGTPVFVGIARAAAADRYLSGVSYATVAGPVQGHPSYLEHAGAAPAVPPGQAGIWAVRAAGPGTQTLSWPVTSGNWTFVVMNANGSAPVSATVNVAATVPVLTWAAVGLLIAGMVMLLAGALLIAVPARRAGQAHATPSS